MQFTRTKKDIHGVFLLDKPLGLSSNTALQQVKRLFQASKAGHTGTLDPLATGLLPVCLGEATKFSNDLLEADKTYQAIIKLGVTTATGDAEGEILVTRPIDVTAAKIELALQQFNGKITQIPPMYSALKHQGKPLYEYARAGVDIDRAAREVTIHSLILDSWTDDELSITVSCSKGTYIRTLAEDIGETLGCGAHITALRRTAIAEFNLAAAVSLADLEKMDEQQKLATLMPLDYLVKAYRRLVLQPSLLSKFLQGQEISDALCLHPEVVRIYDENGGFWGLGEVIVPTRIKPKRLLVQSQ